MQSISKYAPIRDWGALSGMGRTATYNALARGDMRAIKVGVRTLIDVEHGLAWLASLPAATIGAGRSAARPTTDAAAAAASLRRRKTRAPA
jgi:hypothetical protein